MDSSRSDRPAPPPTPPAPGTYIDWGPVLPEASGAPRIVALVRDPERFFVFWEGGDALRARDVTDGTSRVQAVASLGSWYFEGVPEHDVEVDLLLGDRVVAVSRRIRLPRRLPAAAVDADWAPTPEQEALLGRLAGSLDVLMKEDDEPLNADLLRRRPGGGSWPTSPGHR